MCFMLQNVIFVRFKMTTNAASGSVTLDSEGRRDAT